MQYESALSKLLTLQNEVVAGNYGKAQALMHEVLQDRDKREAVAKQMHDAMKAIYNCEADCSCEMSNEELKRWDKVGEALKAYKDTYGN